jgi:hypothetical protein
MLEYNSAGSSYNPNEFKKAKLSATLPAINTSSQLGVGTA